ncbi:phenylalanine--tRNA ligase subunit beta [Sulfuriflexus sp.]|uniref:phenylalanine--tRNA ligase subunit beta n=1 Tax=Sulfuriflexus sp. TaxID=2015443 RepID=UPI0028CCE39D|nr:phenylalanine--tRNA ligase subunit beta [Sulfuriflexus sp.]MDT8405220.1 phenylalanine--tRNA ligase subunit beta [Sulfuriflexus sp.]
MKFSEQWLREWVNPAVSTEELGHRLTMAGLEVDAIEPVAGEFSQIVVGEVIDVAPHPDADRLRVCKVDVGEAEPLQIVCGAANVVTGMHVPTALVGAKLPGGMKIKKGKLRGVESFGMLCSAAELGLVEEAEGLLPLPSDATSGINVRDYLQLDDVSIELGLTPNRGDCLGVAGLAREAGVLFDLDVRHPEMPDVAATIADTFPVEVQAGADCPRYLGRVLRNINPAADSPWWLQERLRRSGLRSISPVVDVTNYVLLELGQPMHAFDLDKLQGGIQVRRAAAGEPLVLLDGNKVELKPDTLVIADERGPLALAGIMGGEQSGVTEHSRHLFLESAFFAPESIAGRARGYGLHTDSSHRFERGVDPQLQKRAMERATVLLLEIVGGEAGPVIEVVSEAHLPRPVSITLRAGRIERVLGIAVPAAEVTSMLERLGMQVEAADGQWQVTPPGFRFDISLEVDLIEEIGRIYGYDRLPTRHPQAALKIAPCDESRVPLRRIRQRLVDRGYQEAVNYSFIDPAMQVRFSPGQAALALANPLAADMAVMRTSLLPGLVESLKYNLNRQQARVLLFESGVKYLKQDNDIYEERTLAGVVSGTVLPEQWAAEKRAFDYFDLKADVEDLLAMSGSLNAISFEAAENPVYHPGQSAKMSRNGEEIGWIGALHPVLAREMGLTAAVFAFEMRLDALQKGELPGFSEVSRYPSIRRDIAIIVDNSLAAEKVCRTIREAAGDKLHNLELFDVYSGKGIDSGRKSLALGLTLQATSRTLTDADVEAVMERVLSTLKTEFDATLRD